MSYLRCISLHLIHLWIFTYRKLLFITFKKSRIKDLLKKKPSNLKTTTTVPNLNPESLLQWSSQSEILFWDHSCRLHAWMHCFWGSLLQAGLLSPVKRKYKIRLVVRVQSTVRADWGVICDRREHCICLTECLLLSWCTSITERRESLALSAVRH